MTSEDIETSADIIVLDDVRRERRASAAIAKAKEPDPYADYRRLLGQRNKLNSSNFSAAGILRGALKPEIVGDANKLELKIRRALAALLVGQGW